MLDLCTFDFECAFVEYEKKKHELSMLTQNKHYLWNLCLSVNKNSFKKLVLLILFKRWHSIFCVEFKNFIVWQVTPGLVKI